MDMKMILKLFFVLLCWFISLQSMSQTKTIEAGNMAVTIPSSWYAQNVSGAAGLGSEFIVITDENTEQIYMLTEMDGILSPEHIMQYSLVNNPKLSAEADWDEPEKIRYISFDACSARFNNVYMGATRVGKAITFCDGQYSYALVSMAAPGYDFSADPVITTFRLTGKRSNSVSVKKSAREQLTEMIAEFRDYFGQQISTGITWENLELSPDKNELAFTFGVSMFQKADLDEKSLLELKNELKDDFVSSVNEMAKAFKVIQQCKNEHYSFVIKVVDRDKMPLCQYLITYKDYK